VTGATFRSISLLILGVATGGAVASAVLHASRGPVEQGASTSSATPDLAGSQSPEGETSASSFPERPADVRAASLELLEAAGKNLDGIAAIAAELPEADRLNFTFDAIASIAADDPRGAIQMALALDDSPARSEALRRVAGVLAGLDPQMALAYGDAIESYELGDVYRNAVLEHWAGNDTSGFLSFVESAPPAVVRGASSAFAIAAAIQPEQLLAMLDRVPQSSRLGAERAALDVLVRTNTGAALAHLQSLPNGNARDALYRSAAESYAEHDLDGALAWANALQPPSAEAMNGALWVLARTDPVRGVDVLIERLQTGGGPNAGFDANLMLQAFTPGARENMFVIAERLSGVDSAAVTTIFDNFMNDWATDDPVAAYDWAIANPERLTSSALAFVARELAGARPELAMEAADRLPPNTRGLWIGMVAGEMGRGNLDGALQWISRYQGQPVYQEAFGRVLESASLSGAVEDPASLALLLDRQSADVRANSIAVVANAWAEHDPVAAAAWVERASLTGAGEERRHAAILNVAARWADRDADAAGTWVLGLAADETRDSAIYSVLAATIETGSVDTRLIEAFSSDVRRQRSLSGLMRNLGRSDPDLGREIISRYIDDPAMRAEAEQNLVAGMSGPGLPSGNVVQLR
jgi:hypothetical protein